MFSQLSQLSLTYLSYYSNSSLASIWSELSTLPTLSISNRRSVRLVGPKPRAAAGDCKLRNRCFIEFISQLSSSLHWPLLIAPCSSDELCFTDLLSTSRSKAARGPSWSFKPTELYHARLSWCVLQNLILYGGSYQSVHPGGQEPTINTKNESLGCWEQAQAHRPGRTYGVTQGGGSVGGSGHHEHGVPRAWGAERECSA
eukprot:5121462-Pleurochrysis_carterae.AAC.1